jgi:uncharacterized protein (TIGR03118 family)
MLLPSWLTPIRRASRRRPSSNSYPKARRRLRPALELLEDRLTPSSYGAAAVADLIADINAANQQGGSNTISLVPGQVFALSSVDNVADGATGLPVIAANDNLTIIGNGDTIARSSTTGTPAFRLFDVAVGGALTLQNLTLQGGLAFGVGMSAPGSAQGGAIYSQGTLDLISVTVQNNIARGNNGANYLGSAGQSAEGGGIFSGGSLILEASTIVLNNQALGGIGGQGRTAGLVGRIVVFHGGPGGTGGFGLGGGIYVADGTAQIDSATLTGNSARGGQGGQGGLPKPNSTQNPGPGGIGGYGLGGALYLARGTLTVDSVSIVNNSALGAQGGPGGPRVATSTTPAAAGGNGGNGIGGGAYVAGGVNAGGNTATFHTDTISHNSASLGAGGAGTSVGQAGIGEGGGLGIETAATVCLDPLTQANVTMNSASTVDPDIHGPWQSCSTTPSVASSLAAPRSSASLRADIVLGVAPSIGNGEYKQVNLAGFQPGMGRFTDPKLNGWGMDHTPNGPFAIANSSTGTITFYDAHGRPLPTVVTVPAAPGQPVFPIGSPTGLVYNPTSDFVISAHGKSAPATFLIDTLDGLVCGWNPAVDPNNAIVIVDNSAQAPFAASYTGLTIGRNGHGQNILYAADSGGGPDISNDRIDMFDGHFHAHGSFTDPNVARQYPGNTVFQVENEDDKLFVTFAGFAAPFGGVVDVFDMDGHLLTPNHFAANAPGQGPLENPWGIVQAPERFGQFSNDLLIGNVEGDGNINAFDPTTGAFLGKLKRPDGTPTAITGLWDLEFGGGRPLNGRKSDLYFDAGFTTADPAGNGLFGVIRAVEHGPDFSALQDPGSNTTVEAPRGDWIPRLRDRSDPQQSMPFGSAQELKGEVRALVFSEWLSQSSPGSQHNLSTSLSWHRHRVLPRAVGWTSKSPALEESISDELFARLADSDR